MKRSGFTLIELVVSTALMSMILAGAYICLQAGVAAQKLVDSREEIFQSARVSLALMTADLRGACPISKDFDFVGMQRTLNETRADNLDFATHNYTPRRPAEGDWCEVSYFLDRDQATGSLCLWRRRDASPDDEPFSGGTREEIAHGLAGLRLEYYDGLDWFDEWGDPKGRNKNQESFKTRTNLSGLPEAVRITLSFETESETPGKAPDGGERAAPLAFQTVARLNLAPVSSRLNSGSSQTGGGRSGSEGPGAGAQGNPEGVGR